MTETVLQVLSVVRLAEKLKCTLRHSWLSDGRQESVAEHSWRMALLALLVAPHLDTRLNVERLLKMVIIHDLVEAITGDVPVFYLLDSATTRAFNKQAECDAMERIAKMLPSMNAEEVESLWWEFEESSTTEARVAKALDKLEAQIQHNEASLATWLEAERNLMLRLEEYTRFDRFLDHLRIVVVEETNAKFEREGKR